MADISHHALNPGEPLVGHHPALNTIRAGVIMSQGEGGEITLKSEPDVPQAPPDAPLPPTTHTLEQTPLLDTMSTTSATYLNDTNSSLETLINTIEC